MEMEMSDQTKMILAFGALGLRVYEGTVPPAEKARRRRKNKAAKAQRKINRGR